MHINHTVGESSAAWYRLRRRRSSRSGIRHRAAPTGLIGSRCRRCRACLSRASHLRPSGVRWRFSSDWRRRGTIALPPCRTCSLPRSRNWIDLQCCMSTRISRSSQASQASTSNACAPRPDRRPSRCITTESHVESSGAGPANTHPATHRQDQLVQRGALGLTGSVH